jgi:hypothetical protein
MPKLGCTSNWTMTCGIDKVQRFGEYDGIRLVFYLERVDIRLDRIAGAGI